MLTHRDEITFYLDCEGSKEADPFRRDPTVGAAVREDRTILTINHIVIKNMLDSDNSETESCHNVPRIWATLIFNRRI